MPINMSSNTAFLRPFQLIPLFQEKVWGRRNLAPFYPNHVSDYPIGEVWFTFKENRTKSGETLGQIISTHPDILGSAYDPFHPDQCPLLVKLLFTTERLSVQVHPGDDYAQRHHRSLGKTEAWYVAATEPEAEVAVGFKELLSSQRLEQAARSGEIAALLDWRAVKTGDVIFVPAGTVHAIGAGVTICEIQQNSDITYRLYDYGRPRELHLAHGVNVSHLGPAPSQVTPRTLAPGREELALSAYFRIERLRAGAGVRFGEGSAYYMLLTCLSGHGQIAGDEFAAGETWLIPAHAEEFSLSGASSEWLLSYTSDAPAGNVFVEHNAAVID
jgi:mannose-6-phosphate isomerase